MSIKSKSIRVVVRAAWYRLGAVHTDLVLVHPDSASVSLINLFGLGLAT
jgi:hypothetical protein